MKKLLLFAAALLMPVMIIAENTPTPSASVATLDVTATATTIKTQKPTATPTPTPSPTPKKAVNYIIKTKTNIKMDYKHDSEGSGLNNSLAVELTQMLADNWRAVGSFKLTKPVNNESGNVDIKLYEAKFEHVGTFFWLLFGRANFSGTLSTLQYFGPYITSGLRYLDVVGCSVPIFLKAGVPEIEEYEMPPIAISAYYVPAMMSKDYTSYYDRREEYIMGQIRVNATPFESPLVFIINAGKSSYGLVNKSVLSGNFAIDTSVSIDLAQHYKVALSYGIENVTMNETQAIAAGVEIHNFSEWLFVIDKIVFEQQIALNASNEMTWFALAENHISKFRYGIAASNSTNQFTLGNVPTYSPMASFGPGNEYAPENIIFNNTDASKISYYAYVGYDF
jgi:hypothetical protein